VLISIATVALFQVLFVYTGPFQQLFDSRPLAADTWNRIWLLGAGMFIVVEMEKLLRRMLRRRLSARAPQTENPDP
jgi:hypothetical protein